MSDTPRLVWHRNERRAVMAEVLRLEQSGLHLNQPEMVRRAQQVLPITRRRAIIPSPIASDLFQKMRALVASGHLEAAKAPAPPPEPPAPAPAPPPAPETTPEPCPDILVIEKPVYIKQDADWGKIPTPTLVRILCERLANLEEIQANLFNLTESFKRKRAQEEAYDRRLDTRPPDAIPATDALRIVIIGPLPGQQHEIESRTANISRPLKLLFFDSGQGPQQLLPHFDHAIVMRFAHHTWWNRVRAAVPADCVSFIDGGITAVVQKIYDLASRQTPVVTNGNGNGHAHAHATSPQRQ